jgi:hypothetical protein
MRKWAALTALAAALLVASTAMATADTSHRQAANYVSLGDSVTTAMPSFVN